MKKLFETWDKFVNEVDRVTIWSVRARVTVRKPEGAAAVIDDTLALIRAIPSITVVNSDTDQSASDRHRAVLEVEFKFTPRTDSLFSDLKKIRREILGISSVVVAVSEAAQMYGTRQRVQ